MHVSAESDMALPSRLRPSLDEVCSWYERTLRGLGADVERTGRTELEFSVPVAQTLLDMNLEVSLAPFASGRLEVTDTDDGFSVFVRARTRAWTTYVLVGIAAVFAAALTFSAWPLRILTALGGLPVLGLAWLESRRGLDRLLTTTNEAIAASCAAVPPSPRIPAGETAKSEPTAT